MGPGSFQTLPNPATSIDFSSRFRENHGRLDVLHANAGVARLGPLADTTEQMFDNVLGANFRGAYFTVQKALPLISDGGAIVLTASWFAEAGVAGTSAVSGAKAALRNLARTVASELIGPNIRVNAISSGVIETPLFGKLGLAEADAERLGEALFRQIPAKRFGVAAAVAFLASSDASYINGIELAVDGALMQL